MSPDVETGRMTNEEAVRQALADAETYGVIDPGVFLRQLRYYGFEVTPIGPQQSDGPEEDR